MKSFRQWQPPIVARVENDRVLLDLRTIEPVQDATVVAALKSLASA
jgi:hypothetical protein